MKNLILTLIFLLVSLISIGKPTINHSDFILTSNSEIGLLNPKKVKSFVLPSLPTIKVSNVKFIQIKFNKLILWF